MKRALLTVLGVLSASVLLAACAGANPSTAALLGTQDAGATQIVSLTNDAGTVVAMTENAPTLSPDQLTATADTIATRAVEATNAVATVTSNAATAVVLTQNAPPTPTAVPAEPITIAQYEAAADAKTPTEICAEAVPATSPENRTFTEAEQVLESGLDYRAIFCTGAGPVYIDLLEEQTPITVNNFVFLAEQGYYNNTTFHRVLESFMAQGGDPEGTGTGGPGYRFEDEIVPGLTFEGPGKLAMANAGPGTNGSQFFITTAPTSHLNGLHTIFGLVLEGQANVVNIDLRDPSTATEPGETLDTVVIITDPTTVKTTPKPAPLEADVVAAFDGVDAVITEEIASVLENQKFTQTTDEVVSAAPEAAQESLGSWLGAHNHEYRVGSVINNKACDLTQVQFMSVGYSLDAFATVTDAVEAASDAAFADVAAALGYTDQQTSADQAEPIYTQEIAACDTPAVKAMTYRQRGAFLVMVEATFPADSPATGQIGRILNEFVSQQIYEPFLTTVLYSDIQ